MDTNLSFIVILQFVAPFAVLSAILLFAALKTRQKHHKNLQKFVEIIKSSEDSFNQKLEVFLKNSTLNEEEVMSKLGGFSRSRKQFFKQIVDGVIQDDSELLLTLIPKFNAYCELYHSLVFNAAAPIVKTVEVSADPIDEEHLPDNALDVDKEKIRSLNTKVKHQQAELHVANTALNALFSEYASMFGEIPEGKGKLSVKEILDAMVRFTKGDFKPEGITEDLPPELMGSVNDVGKSSSVTEDKMDAEPESPKDDWDEMFKETEEYEKPSSDPGQLSDLNNLVDEPEDDLTWENINKDENSDEESAQESVEENSQKDTDKNLENIKDEATTQQIEEKNVENEEDEPSWEDAFSELTQSEPTKENEEDEHSWEDAFNEEGDKDKK